MFRTSKIVLCHPHFPQHKFYNANVVNGATEFENSKELRTANEVQHVLPPLYRDDESTGDLNLRWFADGLGSPSLGEICKEWINQSPFT